MGTTRMVGIGTLAAPLVAGGTTHAAAPFRSTGLGGNPTATTGVIDPYWQVCGTPILVSPDASQGCGAAITPMLTFTPSPPAFRLAQRSDTA